ncbi:hypothetical protein [Rhodocaloribacter sp.]
MEPASPETPAPPERARPVDAVAAVARRAEALAGRVRGLGVAALVSGAWLWTLAAYPFAFRAWWAWALAGAALAAALFPGVVLLLFDLGLRRLLDLPRRLSDTLDAGSGHAATVYEAAHPATETRGWRRTWALVKSILDLRRLALESKTMLLEYAALWRLLNPWTLLVVLAALVGALALIGAAALATLIVALF